jgi:hypothetical protein
LQRFALQCRRSVAVFSTADETKLRRGYITLNATKKAQSIALCAFNGN